MKFNQNLIGRFQEGGAMPEDPAMAGAPAGAEAGAPEAGAPEGGEDQLAGLAQQLVEMLMQQIGDPQAVGAVLQMALEMVSQAGAPEAPAYQRMGGKLVRIR